MARDFAPKRNRQSYVSPLKVTVAPNGARKTRADHPNLPVTTEEIALTAKACFDVGADEIHLHVRDESGAHSLDPGRYREAMAAIQDVAPEMGIQITTEAAGRYSVTEQVATLQAIMPHRASVSVREAARDFDRAKTLYAFAKETGIALQHILYDRRDLDLLLWFQDKGVIQTPELDVLLVTGAYEPARDALEQDLEVVLPEIEAHATSWAVCAFGRNENEVVKTAIRAGGHVRVGFENNIFAPDGALAKDNAENIDRAVQLAREIGRPLMREVITS